jgi:hypothetical protein
VTKSAPINASRDDEARDEITMKACDDTSDDDNVINISYKRNNEAHDDIESLSEDSIDHLLQMQVFKK